MVVSIMLDCNNLRTNPASDGDYKAAVATTKSTGDFLLLLGRCTNEETPFDIVQCCYHTTSSMGDG